MAIDVATQKHNIQLKWDKKSLFWSQILRD